MKKNTKIINFYVPTEYKRHETENAIVLEIAKNEKFALSILVNKKFIFTNGDTFSVGLLEDGEYTIRKYNREKKTTTDFNYLGSEVAKVFEKVGLKRITKSNFVENLPL